MITLYYDISSASCKQAARWFMAPEIKVKKKRIKTITRRDLIHSLSLSHNGFLDVLKQTSRSSTQLTGEVKAIENMNFNEGVDYLLEHKYLLRTPLIIDEEKIVIGYNSENMRVFLSRAYREVSRQ